MEQDYGASDATPPDWTVEVRDDRAWYQPPGWLVTLAVSGGVAVGVWAGVTFPGLGGGPAGNTSAPQQSTTTSVPVTTAAEGTAPTAPSPTAAPTTTTLTPTTTTQPPTTTTLAPTTTTPAPTSTAPSEDPDNEEPEDLQEETATTTATEDEPED